MSSLRVINRVYRLEIQSVLLVFYYFRPSFVNHCPFRLLSGSPPPFPKSKYCTENKDSLWLGVGGGCWVVLETIFCRSLTLCFWPDSEPTKLLHYPKQKPRRGRGLRQINTCARNYRPSCRENKPITITLGFNDWIRAFWACFHENAGL